MVRLWREKPSYHEMMMVWYNDSCKAGERKDRTMAAFCGTVEGNRGMTSRTGSKASGITTTAQSHGGSVKVLLYEQNGQLVVEVRIAPDSSGWRWESCFFGTLDELKAKLAG